MVQIVEGGYASPGTSDGSRECAVPAWRFSRVGTIAAGLTQSNRYATMGQMATVCFKCCLERVIEGMESMPERQQRIRGWAKNSSGRSHNCRYEPRCGEAVGGRLEGRCMCLHGPQTGRWPGVVSIWATAKVLAHKACENPERESIHGLFEYFDCLWKCLAALLRRYSGSTTSFPQAIRRRCSSKTSGVKLISAPLPGLSGRPCIPPLLLTSPAVPVR
jgi:hypothetical protein